MECKFAEIKGQGRVPYVRELLSYHIGDFEGILVYNGYFYVDDDDLPIQAELYISLLDPNSKEENVVNNIRITSYKSNIIIKKTVEIYKREKMEDTSRCDSEGICLFPTCKEKVSFRVLSSSS